MIFLFSSEKEKKEEGEEQNGFASWVAILLFSLMRMREFTNSHTYKHLKYNSQQVSKVILFSQKWNEIEVNRKRKNDSFSRFMPLPSTRRRCVRFHYAIGPVPSVDWSAVWGVNFGKKEFSFFSYPYFDFAYLSFPVSTNQIYFLGRTHTIRRTHHSID